MSAPSRAPIIRRFGFETCFACGPANARGLRLSFEREGDQVIATAVPPREFGGYGTILHGGLTSTLLDEAMAWAVYGLLDRLSMTTELRVRFLGPVRCNDALTVVGRVASHDAQGAVAHAEVRDSAGVVRADGVGVMRFLSERAAERLSRDAGTT